MACWRRIASSSVSKKPLWRCFATTMSFSSGVSSDRISVPHVPLTSVRFPDRRVPARPRRRPWPCASRSWGSPAPQHSKGRARTALSGRRPSSRRNVQPPGRGRSARRRSRCSRSECPRVHPSLGAEVVLRVDDNHRRRPWVDREGFRPRVDNNAASFAGQTKRSIPDAASPSKQLF